MDYDLLKKVIQDIKFKSWEKISYEGLDFLFFPCKFNKEDILLHKSPCFFKPSDIADWDIYFGMNLIEEPFRKPVLFHEISEITIYNSLLRKSLLDDKSIQKSHKTAKILDSQYAKEIFDEETYMRYECFKDRWENLF